MSALATLAPAYWLVEEGEHGCMEEKNGRIPIRVNLCR
jgi:hypothetical protein